MTCYLPPPIMNVCSNGSALWPDPSRAGYRALDAEAVDI